jgi:hypothetical protein
MQKCVTVHRMAMQEAEAQLVVRVPESLRALLEADADEHGRTLSQTVRWHLARAMSPDRAVDPQPEPRHRHSWQKRQGGSGVVVEECACGARR